MSNSLAHLINVVCVFVAAAVPDALRAAYHIVSGGELALVRDLEHSHVERTLVGGAHRARDRGTPKLMRQDRSHEGLHMRDRTTASKSTNAAKVPNITFLTGPWNPEEVVSANRRFVPSGTEFRYYDDAHVDASVSRISAELERAGVDGALAAYKALRPYAFRADLWRYLVLWDHGGIYLDAKIRLNANLSTWVDQNNFSCCNDLWQLESSIAKEHGLPQQVLFNAAMAAPPRHPGTLAVVNHTISNIRKRFYGSITTQPWLEPTGPVALTVALAKANVRPSVKCELVSGPTSMNGHTVDSELRSWPGYEKALMALDSGEHSHMHECPRCNTYGSLWRDHAVYCDEEYNGAEADPCKAETKTSKNVTTLVSTCAWRQTGGCSAKGNREPWGDKACTAIIDDRASGFCDCNGNGVMDENNVEYDCLSTPGVCIHECHTRLRDHGWRRDQHYWTKTV